MNLSQAWTIALKFCEKNHISPKYAFANSLVREAYCDVGCAQIHQNKEEV